MTAAVRGFASGGRGLPVGGRGLPVGGWGFSVEGRGFPVEWWGLTVGEWGVSVEWWSFSVGRWGFAEKCQNSGLGVDIYTKLGTRIVKLGTRIAKLGTRIVKLGTRIVKLGTRIVKLGTRIVKLGTRIVKLGGVDGGILPVVPAFSARLWEHGSPAHSLSPWHPDHPTDKGEGGAFRNSRCAAPRRRLTAFGRQARERGPPSPRPRGHPQVRAAGAASRVIRMRCGARWIPYARIRRMEFVLYLAQRRQLEALNTEQVAATARRYFRQPAITAIVRPAG